MLPPKYPHDDFLQFLSGISSGIYCASAWDDQIVTRHSDTVHEAMRVEFVRASIAAGDWSPPEIPASLRMAAKSLHATLIGLDVRPVPWLETAMNENGVSTFPVGSSNPRITEYHVGTNIEGYDDKASWCSSFVQWSLAQVGIAGTRSALARSWLEWGAPLTEPTLGCIAVLWREDPASWKGHVGFYMWEDDESVYLFGGNQLNEVRFNSYPKDTVLAYRWPAKG
jgi:uncharacterized protein (TIGR02594 family)